MGVYVRLVVAMVALLLSVRPGSAWCGATDADDWREFYSLWGADLSRGANRPVLFVIGAPWCPYCAELLKTYQSKTFRFDIRFVPKDAMNELHRNQLADLVVDGGVKSVVRVFEQRRADTSKIAPTVHKRINDVQLTVLNSLNARFAAPGQPMASPTVFYLTRQGVQRFTGMPNLAYVEQHIVADPMPVSRHASRRFIEGGIPSGRPIGGTPYAKRDNVRLRLLPDADGFSVACLAAGHGFDTRADLVEVDGRKWLAFRGAFRGVPNSTLYGRADDFEGWVSR